MPTQQSQAAAEGMPEIPETSTGNKNAKRAVETSYVVLATLHVCKAATYYLEDQQNSKMSQTLPGSIAHLIDHVTQLAGSVHDFLELAAKREEVRQ